MDTQKRTRLNCPAVWLAMVVLVAGGNAYANSGQDGTVNDGATSGHHNGPVTRTGTDTTATASDLTRSRDHSGMDNDRTHATTMDNSSYNRNTMTNGTSDGSR